MTQVQLAPCSFCDRPGAYAFVTWKICPSCARESHLELISTLHNETLAYLIRRGQSTYLFTPDPSLSPAEGAAEMASAHATLNLIARQGEVA